MKTKKASKKALTGKIISKIQEALDEINTKASGKMNKVTTKKAKQLANEFSIMVEKVAKKEKAAAKKLEKQAAKNSKEVDRPSFVEAEGK